MSRKPSIRQRAKRRAWLRRYVSVLSFRLANHTFPESYFRGKHYTTAGQRKLCRDNLAKAEKELVGMAKTEVPCR